MGLSPIWMAGDPFPVNRVRALPARWGDAWAHRSNSNIELLRAETAMKEYAPPSEEDAADPLIAFSAANGGRYWGCSCRAERAPKRLHHRRDRQGALVPRDEAHRPFPVTLDDRE
jgi:hypothetical protein